MKQIILTLLIAFLSWSTLNAQEKPQVYNPDADAAMDVKAAVNNASAEQKHIFLFIGGNWCPWCLRLNAFIFDDPQLDSLITANYEVVKVNYSKENKNLALLKELGAPQRFGFPVLVILDDKGKVLHTQNSLYLEKEKSYDRGRIWEFLLGWNYEAVRPENQKDYR
jgi:thioredoxin-related protein